MAARDIGTITDPDKIFPKIEKSVLPRSNTAPDVEQNTNYEERVMTEMGLVKKSINYTMYLASASLGIMTMILLLQGFRPHGFYIEGGVLATLMPSLSAAAALNALGWIAGKALGNR